MSFPFVENRAVDANVNGKRTEITKTWLTFLAHRKYLYTWRWLTVFNSDIVEEEGRMVRLN